MENKMIILNTQHLKNAKVIYLTLSLLSNISLPVQAMDGPDVLSESRESHFRRKSQKSLPQKEIKEYRPERYKLVGISLFSGEGFESDVISAATSDPISHVGLILSDIDNSNNDEKKWYSFESTGSVGAFLKSGFNADNYLEKWREHLKVQVTPWTEAVNKYKGSVSYRSFQFDDLITEESKNIISNGVTKAVETYEGDSYTNDASVLIRALLGSNERRHTMPTDNFFCSELVAQVLMDLDILAAGTPANFLPKHFRSTQTLAEKLEVGFVMRRGVSLSEEKSAK